MTISQEHNIYQSMYFLTPKSQMLRSGAFEAMRTKETTLERADFTLQMLMFVTAEKEGQMFIIIFLPIFWPLLSPLFEARTG